MAAVDAPRLAKNYAMVFDIVRANGAGRHVTAAQVLAQAKIRNPGIGETTVYRALARLRELGLVSEIAIAGSDSAFYELAAAAPHAHFQCDRCGRIDDVAYAIAGEIVEDLARRHGAQISGVQLSLHGLCSSCKDPGA